MRCFIAIELPLSTQSALRLLQAELAAQLAEAHCGHVVRWTAPESIHLTLRFLGETSQRQCAQIGAGLQSLAAHALSAEAAPQKILLTLQGVGCFPNTRRPNVVWAGVAGATASGATADVGSLRAIQHAAEELARAAGFDPEDRPYTPHLTLGRMRREAAAADLRRAGEVFDLAAASPTVRAWLAPLPVEAVSLMHSDLQPTGAIYTALARVPLFT